MSENELKRAIQSYNFAAYDMLLYLDTHPDDKKAFAIFSSLSEKTKELKAAYQAKYGPLSIKSAARQDKFNWTKGPWPWEKEANC